MRERKGGKKQVGEERKTKGNIECFTKKWNKSVKSLLVNLSHQRYLQYIYHDVILNSPLIISINYLTTKGLDDDKPL